MTQKKIKEGISDLSHRKEIIAEALRILRARALRRRREIEKEFYTQIEVLLGIWEKDDAGVEALRQKCAHRFHRESARYGHCPDCRLFRRNPRDP